MHRCFFHPNPKVMSCFLMAALLRFTMLEGMYFLLPVRMVKLVFLMIY